MVDGATMNLIDRRLALVTVLLTFGTCAPVLASDGSGDDRASVGASDDASAADAPERDDAEDGAAPAPTVTTNPFCFTDEDPDGLDEVDSEIEEDPAYAEGDIVDEEVGDEPVDLDAILDFCDDGPTGGKPAVGSLKRALNGLAVPTDTMNISVPGTISRTARLSKAGLPKVLRPYANLTLGSATQVARSDGFLDLPVRLDKNGRKALRRAKGDVKLVLESKQTLPSGQSRTRSQNIVLER